MSKEEAKGKEGKGEQYFLLNALAKPAGIVSNYLRWQFVANPKDKKHLTYKHSIVCFILYESLTLLFAM